ncbi:ferrochelatase [Campylobacter sp. JMF_01 NE2]|uniref:ferrochelatase n=1 Tax=unclassified Campylobacter TaxID=2593542 RepID=UPI0022E9DBC3|nr:MULTISPECIES: ferrochelatase [unclassified Campylobacter]MDA3052600.1 ferrochelatase [Campylobacter sp. JMF_03 NE3]MDA3066931.1 ferrochelatase [Campylobacter sp. JMF_01 NE2]
MKKALILLNMGGPNSLDEVSVFLKNMFCDPNILGVKSKILRKILASLITKMRVKEACQNYEKLGGKSPIAGLTKRLCDKINLYQNEFVCDFAMNYTAPFARDVLAKYAKFDEILLFPLYPHFSQTTVKSSIDDAKKALVDLEISNFKIVDIFYKSEIYNQILLNLIKEKIKNLSADEISRTSLVFSAHSLPVKIIAAGDPYEAQVNEHVKILSEILQKSGIKFKDISLAYQSRLGPVKWLEPNLNEHLANLQNERALIFPISFCIDNSETKFELDMYFRNVAKELKFSYFEVCECPNFSDEFASFIITHAQKTQG